jgi:FlaA1/EpsC-like NDP-sugar epimerase
MTEAELLRLIGRDQGLFEQDLIAHRTEIDERISQGRFLVVGGAGSIGSAVVRELFRRNPRVLHVIDINENNLAELVRDIRGSFGYGEGEFHAYCFDALGREFEAFANQAHSGKKPSYDYVLNFAALKHVRSEKDPFTLMRMLDVNIFLTRRLLDFAVESGSKKFFCVSTDKAANPVNLMGASKRIMEMFLLEHTAKTEVSTARFANVLFSDGSLPHAWTQRLEKGQPLSAPRDVKRYFISPREAAILCLFSVVLGKHGEIFFPKLSAEEHLVDFPTLARNYLEWMGYTPVECETEEEARTVARLVRGAREWPCYFFDSDTTGEKEFEEFYTSSEPVSWKPYNGMGIARIVTQAKMELREQFITRLNSFRERNEWSKSDILNCVEILLPTFAHLERGRHLDNRM